MCTISQLSIAQAVDYFHAITSPNPNVNWLGWRGGEIGEFEITLGIKAPQNAKYVYIH